MSAPQRPEEPTWAMRHGYEATWVKEAWAYIEQAEEDLLFESKSRISLYARTLRLEDELKEAKSSISWWCEEHNKARDRIGELEAELAHAEDAASDFEEKCDFAIREAKRSEAELAAMTEAATTYHNQLKAAEALNDNNCQFYRRLVQHMEARIAEMQAEINGLKCPIAFAIKTGCISCDSMIGDGICDAGCICQAASDYLAKYDDGEARK